MTGLTRRAVWLGLLVAAVGCGSTDRLWPAAGRVTFADGTPLAGGVIECRPANGPGPTARGAIAADGRFSLETSGRPGARAGSYRVVVLPPLVVGHAPHGAGVATRFGAFDSSGLGLDVPAGGTTALTVVVEAGR